MKKIPLTKGRVAIVDNEDFERLAKFKWCVTSHGYAQTQIDGVHVYMHRLVNKTPKGSLTDHINRDTLDNRRANLRIADKRINSINRGLQSNNTSGHKGISWAKRLKKWETYIWQNQKKILLGYFSSINEAVLVRKKAEKEYHVS